jgi:MFS family permease
MKGSLLFLLSVVGLAFSLLIGGVFTALLSRGPLPRLIWAISMLVAIACLEVLVIGLYRLFWAIYEKLFLAGESRLAGSTLYHVGSQGTVFFFSIFLISFLLNLAEVNRPGRNGAMAVMVFSFGLMMASLIVWCISLYLILFAIFARAHTPQASWPEPPREEPDDGPAPVAKAPVAPSTAIEARK